MKKAANKEILDSLYSAMDVLIENVSILSSKIEYIIEEYDNNNDASVRSLSSLLVTMEKLLFETQRANVSVLGNIPKIREQNGIKLNIEDPTGLLFRDAYDFQSVLYNIPLNMIRLGDMIQGSFFTMSNDEINKLNEQIIKDVKEAEEQFENVKETLGIIKKELKKKDYKKSVLV